MAVQVSDSFSGYVKQTAGDALRLVALYTADSYSMKFAREDITGEYAKRDIDAVMEDIREVSDLGSQAHLREMAGELQCQVLCYEGAVAVIFPLSEHEGVVVSLDATAASQLHDFVSSCRRYLDSSS